MKITVFGASGGIGQHFIRFATERGHSIRAVYRVAPTVPPNGQVEILVNPNIFDPAFIAQAIGGVDLVITALGPAFVKSHNPLSKMVSPPDIHQRLARTLVSAMKAAGGPTRVISVSTGSMGPGDAVMGIGPRLFLGFFRTFVARNLGLVGRDLALMEHELAASGLDWYAVRPAKLTDGPLTKRIQASQRFAMKPISRADVAWYMLSLAEDPTPRHRTPMLVSGKARESREFPQLAASASESRKVAAR
jgi:uncharacterized protein YbjT (DUF2867 family)